MQHFNLKILGKVQGVFFREGAREKANEFNITGFIKNLSDGTVYAEVEGKLDDLEKFIEWCHKGPEGAKIEKVKVEEEGLENFNEFRVE